MSHTEFAHLLSRIGALSPEQMRQLSRELETRLAEAEKQPARHGQGSPGAMREAADELDEAVERAMDRRQADATPAPARRKRIWEVAEDLRRSVPAEEWAKLPADGAEQHDHYIYGTPKRPPAR
jgi:hypothetical protein